jgi:hypothetical protein
MITNPNNISLTVLKTQHLAGTTGHTEYFTIPIIYCFWRFLVSENMYYQVI